MKNIIITILIIVLISFGAFYFIQKKSNEIVTENENNNTAEEMSEEKQDQMEVDKTETIIGKSVEGKDITAYHFYSNNENAQVDTKLLFIGGIHGGYSWNTSLVAYELMDYLKNNNSEIPENVEVTVIPSMNIDGLSKVTGTDGQFSKSDVSATDTERVLARFNENDVDLNRNFDCEWQATSKWQNKDVSGGDKAFSEPESQTIQSYVDKYNPNAVVVWYSAGGGVFASSCKNGVSDETKSLTNIYAKASGYKPYESFNFYEITGDMVNWLAKKNIPAISVLLTTHTDTEWSKNQKGIEAILKHYAK